MRRIEATVLRTLREAGATDLLLKQTHCVQARKLAVPSLHESSKEKREAARIRSLSLEAMYNAYVRACGTMKTAPHVPALREH